MNRPRVRGPSLEASLSDRQAMVLRVLVAAYVGQAGAVSSQTLKHLMPVALSAASVRNTLAELHEMGLIDKAHASAGRVPTAVGLRVFIDDLVELGVVGPHQQRLLDRSFEDVDATRTPRHASHLLSEHTRQLGFVMPPRPDGQRLRSLHLVRVSQERLLAVLVAQNGGVIQRVIDAPEVLSTRELERIGEMLAERVAGRTLHGLRGLLEAEQRELQGRAGDLLRQAWALGLRACAHSESEDLVVATRLALLDQPEFSDPGRIRGLFATLETNRRLLDLLHEIAQTDKGEARVGLSVSLGDDLGEPSLRDCALVAIPYGATGRGSNGRDGTEERGGSAESSAGFDADGGALGVLGVIGPQRMDYGRVIPLVSYCSELVTRKLLA